MNPAAAPPSIEKEEEEDSINNSNNGKQQQCQWLVNDHDHVNSGMLRCSRCNERLLTQTGTLVERFG